MAEEENVYKVIYCNDFLLKTIYNIFKQTDLEFLQVIVGLSLLKNKVVLIK